MTTDQTTMLGLMFKDLEVARGAVKNAYLAVYPTPGNNTNVGPVQNTMIVVAVEDTTDPEAFSGKKDELEERSISRDAKTFIPAMSRSNYGWLFFDVTEMVHMITSKLAWRPGKSIVFELATEG